MHPIIITGGPGAGKTTLLGELGERGYLTFPEVSRALIQQESVKEDGVLPWTDLPGFAALCFDWMLAQQAEARHGARLAFVDRAIGDICAYLEIGGVPVSEEYLTAAKGYHSMVYCCAPHAGIYEQNDERPHSFEEALQIHHQLVSTYQALGYKVVEVPWSGIEERASWMLAHLTEA